MWILATFLGILLFFVFILAVPFDLVFHFEKDVDFKWRVTVRWMFGLIDKDIGGKKKEPEEKKKKKSNIKPLIAMLRSTGFLRKSLKFIKDSIRLVKVHELKIEFRVGLGDPAETGMLFAVITPILFYMKSLHSLEVNIQPDFEHENLHGYFNGDLRVFPIRFVIPGIFFAFSPTTIRAIKAMVVARRK